jgi:cytochrome P450 family 135
MATPPTSRVRGTVQSLRFIRDPAGFFERLRARHGDVFEVRFLGFGDLTYVASAELARQVFATDQGGSVAGAPRAPFMEQLVGKQSLLTTDGELWARQRKLLTPPMHGERITRYRERIAEIAAEEAAKIPLGRPVAMRPHMQRVTLEVILRVVFGIEDVARLERLRWLLPRVVEVGELAAISPPGVGRASPPRRPRARALHPLWRRFTKLREEVDSILYDEIARRRGRPTGGDDVLSLLLDARDESGSPMTDVELRDQLVTLLEAGHETTATALAWTFERLVRTPEAGERLREELDAGEEAYLDATVKEILRVRPVLADVVRRLTEPLEVAGFELSPGTDVGVAILAVHMDPEIYPEPHEFRPERFLGERPPPHAWLPFGGGRRRCVGSQLALLELKAIIPAVLARLDLRPADPAPEPARMRHVTLAPARGATVIAERREGAVAERAGSPAAVALAR